MHSCGVLLVTSAWCLVLPLLHGQNVSEQYLLAAANRDRQQAGRPSLKVDALLCQAAQAHALQMAEHGTISHQFTGEPDLAARAGAAGVHFSLVTENVAEAPTSLKIHGLWMQSAGHRANLLDAAVDSVGIAVLSRQGQLYAVEDFARSVQELSLAEQERAIAALLVWPGLRIEEGKDDARQTCSMKTGYAGLRQPWFVMRFTTSSLDRIPEQLAARLATGNYRTAQVGACHSGVSTPFAAYSFAVTLFW